MLKEDMIFLGAGGHARVIYNVCLKLGFHPKYFMDPSVENFYNTEKIEKKNLLNKNISKAFISFAGTKISILKRRWQLYDELKNNFDFPAIISSHSILSGQVSIEDGVFISNNVVIHENTKIGALSIINTGAIIEHDVVIEKGCHICPGAIVLGGAIVKEFSIVGAGAVILPGTIVKEESFIPSQMKV